MRGDPPDRIRSELTVVNLTSIQAFILRDDGFFFQAGQQFGIVTNHNYFLEVVLSLK
jgi:hypothetical protein